MFLGETRRSSPQLSAVSVDRYTDSEKPIRYIEEDGMRVISPLFEEIGHAVIDRYGLRNPHGRGVPHPATYVGDEQGIVRRTFVEADCAARRASEIILTASKALQ